jgi:hypothetical protein
LFGTELNNTADEPQCPPGDEGLMCRRMEARRGAHECAGGKNHNILSFITIAWRLFLRHTYIHFSSSIAHIRNKKLSPHIHAIDYV